MVGENFRVKGPPSHGFTILYNSAARILLGEHSAVVRCYLCLCIRSNDERQMYVSMKKLAEDMGMAIASAEKAVKRLEEVGLLKVTRPTSIGRGKANEYELLMPVESPQPTGDIRVVYPQSSTPEVPSPLGTNNNGVEQRKEKTTAPKSDQGKGAEIRGGGASPAGVSGVSNPVDAYFQDPVNGPVRSWQFDQVFGKYPKQENERAARAAWMHRIGTQMDQARQGADPESPAVKLWLAVFYAVDWWNAKVTGKLGEDAWKPQYIMTMDKWISQEKWMDAPRCVREGNC